MNANTAMILALPALCLVVFAVGLIVLAARSLSEAEQKKESWPAFAQSVGGVYIARGSGKPDQVTGRIDEWPFVLDTYVAGDRQGLRDYTRLRAFYIPRQPFEAILYTREADEPLPGHANLTTVDVAGVAPDVTVKSTDPEKIQVLLAEPALLQLLMSAMPLNLQIRRRRHWQDGGVSNIVYEVHAQCRGVVTDTQKLQSMYTLVAACLRSLLRQGLATHSLAD